MAALNASFYGWRSVLNAVETFHRHHGAAQSMTWSLMMLPKLLFLQAAHMIRMFKNIADEYIKTQKNTILSRISSFAPYANAIHIRGVHRFLMMCVR